MSPMPDDDNELSGHERAIQSLRAGTSASLEEVRGLFAVEFARLERGAKVRNYLHLLTMANVRAILQRTDDARRTE